MYQVQMRNLFVIVFSKSTILTEKLFNCQICHRSYSNKYSLNRHMKVHDESKAFKCGVCLKVFSYKSSLEAHYRSHTGEKPFACQICDRKFAVKQSLIRHQATHSDDRPFRCSICPEGRYFKTKRNLKEHMIFNYKKLITIKPTCKIVLLEF